MAYASKYHFSFTDHIGRHMTVYIKEDGFTGDSTEVTAGADPVIIETVSDNDNLFNQIYASTCTINLLATTNFQFIGLFTANAFKYLVEVYQEAEPDETETLFWTGYLLPDEYSEPIDFEKNYPVSIMARDVLGVLNEIDFVQNSGNKYVGKQTVIKIISEILKKTKLNLNINFGINLIENDAPDSVSGDTLEGIFLDYQAFYQEKIQDCEYVLKQILQSFGARIIQANGEWWIERIPMYLNSQTIYIYDYNGVLLSSSIVNNVLNYTGKYDITNSRLFFIEKKGNIMINPAYKEFTINQDYGRMESILTNYGFEDNDATSWIQGAATVNITGWNVVDRPSNFTPLIMLTNRGYYSALAAVNWAINMGTQAGHDYYIESAAKRITLSTTKSLRLRYNVSFIQGKARFSNEIRFNGKWLVNEAIESNTLSYDTFTPGQGEISRIYNVSAEMTGYLYVKIISVGSYVEIDDVKIDFVDNFGNAYPEGAEYNIIVDSDNNYKPDTINSSLGDLPEITDKEDIYIGGYWYFDGLNFIPTSSWSYYGSSRQLALIPLLAEAIQDQYRVSKHKISGTLFGNFKLNKTIYITMLGNKYYFPIRTAINCKTCKTEIEAIEIVTETEADGGTVWGTEALDYVVSDTDTLTRV